MKWQRLRTVIKHYQAAEISKNAVVKHVLYLAVRFSIVDLFRQLVGIAKVTCE